MMSRGLAGPSDPLASLNRATARALYRAIRAPGRVASITLLDSAGLIAIDARFYRWLTITGLA